jgi:sulfhydrogenase subunit beta (sulfur reductase)
VSAVVIESPGLDALVEGLRRRGFTVVGPVERSRGIVFDELRSAADLASGVEDVQDGGSYRLRPREDGALFAHTVGHDSVKRFLFPPVLAVWRARRSDDGTLEIQPPPPPPRYAFIGVRSCDLHAVAVQDRVFLADGHADADYEARRHGAFFVAVNCARAGGTCFCTSMGTGPHVDGGHDLALTELIDEGGHRFLVEAGSDRGRELLAELPGRPAEAGEHVAAEAQTEQTAASMGRTMDTDGIRELLQGNPEHSRWADVAERCLSCGNCTLVCPTCFCSTAENVTDLAGEEATHTRLWDSCFTLEHSYVHGGSVRRTTRSRYRQWMTHKLSTWIDQFGSSGCVGCGRCITWCPVAIDITEEVAAIQADDLRHGLDAID